VIHTYRAPTADKLWLQLAEAVVGHDAHSQTGRRLPTRELLHVVFSIENPRDRWIVSRRPPLNPAFALAEVIWILNGCNDAAFLNFWNRRLPQFAGASPTYHGAYGHRLRSHFGIDQIVRAVGALRANPDSRQIALQIFDPSVDLPGSDGVPASADVPCNVTSLLKVRSGRLDWFQVMRSNDLFLGLPHNLVQFTTLQEVLAGWIGVEVGEYHQVSDSLHLYDDHLGSVVESLEHGEVPGPHSSASLSTSLEDGLAAISSLIDKARILTEPGLDKRTLHGLVERAVLPDEYWNWLFILGAESARRRGWHAEAVSLVASCSNEVLKASWLAWLARMTVKSTSPRELVSA